MRGIERVNALSRPDALRELRGCCGSRAWAARMADARPFPDAESAQEAADAFWSDLGDHDRLEAFRAHPPIGERVSGREAEEQAGARKAAPETLLRLAAGNRAYEERFGHVFLVCATGRSAEDMLAELERRLGNDRRAELRIAAEEQRKITRLRLQKLLS